MELKRAIHIDFHTMPGIYDFGEGFDAAVFAETLKQAKVCFVNVFAKCNIGFCYYPSQIGPVYKGMKGDMFGDILKECKKRDIGVIGYFNAGLDHEMANWHRNWCKLDANGHIIEGDRTENFFRTMCLESGYGDYLKSLVKEFIQRYPQVDGVFLDCINFNPCYGAECLKAIRERGQNSHDETALKQKVKESVLDFCTDAKKIVGERRLLCNGVPYWDAKNFSSHIEVECLPSGWSYDFYTANVSYARMIQKEVLYMSGRFQINWGDFGGFKTKASLEYDAWDAISQGAQVSIGDHMHPAGNLDRQIYKVIGEIYSDLEQLEPWTLGAKYCADIGVLAPLDAVHFAKGCYCGLARMFGELKYSFDIINETMDFSLYKLLVLPDTIRITAGLKEKLKAHLEDGGSILSTGMSGLLEERDDFALPEWNFECCGADPSKSPYFQAEKRAKQTLGDFRWASYHGGILMRTKEKENIFAQHIKPYFEKEWDGFHGYFYTPPEKKTGYAAAAISGKVGQICFKAFEAYYESAALSIKELVRLMTEELLKEPLLLCENIPSTARVTLTKKDDLRLLHVKVTYPEPRGKMDIIEEHAVMPQGAVVSVLGEYKKAFTAPDQMPLPCEVEKGRTKITLPLITGYRMIVLS